MCFPISITCPLETFVPRGRYDVLLLRRTGGTRVPFYKSVVTSVFRYLDTGLRCKHSKHSWHQKFF